MFFNRYCLIGLLILASALFDTAKAQSYTVESFDGIPTKIELSESTQGIELTVSCLKDAISLYEYRGIREVHVLDKKFLQIFYRVRGGSGLTLENMALLSVNKGRLNLCMLVYSYVRNVDMGKDYVYKLKFSMPKGNNYTTKLIVDINDEQKYKNHPKDNYIHHKRVVLNFNTSRQIFYDTIEKTESYFATPPDGSGQENKKYISGSFPEIKLGRSHYYFIKGDWYERNITNDLGLEKYYFINPNSN